MFRQQDKNETYARRKLKSETPFDQYLFVDR